MKPKTIDRILATILTLIILISAAITLQDAHAQSRPEVDVEACTSSNQLGRTTITIPPNQTTANIDLPIRTPCRPATTHVTGGIQGQIPVILNTTQTHPHNRLLITATLLQPQPGPVEVQIGWSILQE